MDVNFYYTPHIGEVCVFGSNSPLNRQRCSFRAQVGVFLHGAKLPLCTTHGRFAVEALESNSMNAKVDHDAPDH